MLHSYFHVSQFNFYHTTCTIECLNFVLLLLDKWRQSLVAFILVMGFNMSYVRELGENTFKAKHSALFEHINQLTLLRRLSLEFFLIRENYDELLHRVDLRALAWIEKCRFACTSKLDK